MKSGQVRVDRRLSAILAADVVGYSRLMHNDEEATHARLTMLLADALEPSIEEHGGRIVKNTGDGLLAEFRSAVEAVRAATQFQERVHDLTIGDAEDKRLVFRVGINIGDIIVEAHYIFGDGVNIAARLEGIAEPGGTASRLPLTIKFAVRSRSSSSIWANKISRISLVPCASTRQNRRASLRRLRRACCPCTLRSKSHFRSPTRSPSRYCRSRI